MVFLWFLSRHDVSPIGSTLDGKIKIDHHQISWILQRIPRIWNRNFWTLSFGDLLRNFMVVFDVVEGP